MRGRIGRLRLAASAASVAVTAAVLAVTAAQHAPAAGPRNDQEDTGPTSCRQAAEVQGAPEWSGIPLIGKAVTLTAERTKVVVTSIRCDIEIHAVAKVRWKVTAAPAGSTAQPVSPAATTTLTLDRGGPFTVTVTLCDGGCLVAAPNGAQVRAPAVTRTLTIVARSFVPVPPATEPPKVTGCVSGLPPSCPTSPTAFPDASAKCQGGGGFLDPEWVTVRTGVDARRYELLEGVVAGSRIARKDNPLNHGVNDHNTHVLPDPGYLRLLSTKPESAGSIEAEWEETSFPAQFWPTSGDRVSLFGLWIHDCGHSPYYTEIHPIAGIASHRPRPILLPETSPLIDLGGGHRVGTGAVVPGIVSDIWFNRDNGEVTDCGQTSLHDPVATQTIQTPNGPLKVRPCVAPVGIDQLFEFNVYLPRDPRLIARDYGLTPPPVSVYRAVNAYGPASGSGGPDPQITVETRGEITYLHVRIDLRGYTGARYGRRIVAAWAYPAPDNWGVEAWRVRLSSVDVSDDGDGALRGDGDWRFWFDTNNVSPGWTRLFYGDGNVHGNMTFGGRPWSTSSATSDRSLGGDVLVLPGQRLWIHSSGYEEDTITSDDTGSVNRLELPSPGPRTAPSFCGSQFGSGTLEYVTWSGCAEYTLHYSLERRTVPVPALSPEAQRQYDAYTAFAAPQTPPRPIDAATWFPLDRKLTRSVRVNLRTTPLYETALETFSLTDIANEKLRAAVAAAVARGETRKVEAFVGEFSTLVTRERRTARWPEERAVVDAIRQAIPDAIWRRRFRATP